MRTILSLSVLIPFTVILSGPGAAPAGADDAQELKLNLSGYVTGPWHEYFGPEGIVPPQDTVTAHGTVSGMSGLLGLPEDGAEITWVLPDMVCETFGLWDDPQSDRGGTFDVFPGGTLFFYRDPSANADPDDPASFADGELILEAQVGELYLLSGPTGYPGSRMQEYAGFQFTGGTRFDQASRNGTGFSGQWWAYYLGDFQQTPTEGEHVTLGAMTGYFAVSVPVPVAATTWGGLKTRYH